MNRNLCKLIICDIVCEMWCTVLDVMIECEGHCDAGLVICTQLVLKKWQSKTTSPAAITSGAPDVARIICSLTFQRHASKHRHKIRHTARQDCRSPHHETSTILASSQGHTKRPTCYKHLSLPSLSNQRTATPPLPQRPEPPETEQVTRPSSAATPKPDHMSPIRRRRRRRPPVPGPPPPAAP